MIETECSFPASPSTSPLGNEPSLELLFKFTGLKLCSSWNEEGKDEKLAHRIPETLRKLCHPNVGLNIFVPPTPLHIFLQETKCFTNKIQTQSQISSQFFSRDAGPTTLPPASPQPRAGFHTCLIHDHLCSPSHPLVLLNLIFSSVCLFRAYSVSQRTIMKILMQKTRDDIINFFKSCITISLLLSYKAIL